LRNIRKTALQVFGNQIGLGHLIISRAAAPSAVCGTGVMDRVLHLVKPLTPSE
jgi:hypothetical protein